MRILLALLSVLVGCKPSPSPLSHEHARSVEISSEEMALIQQVSIDEIFARISLKEIKETYASSVTSGVLGKNAARLFMDPVNTRSFGTYFFSIDGQRAALRPYAIKATVSFIGEWRYDSEDEQLQEIVVYAPKIMGWPELSVGDAAAGVVGRIGEPAWRTDTCIFFTQGGCILTIRVENDSVVAYKVGKYAVPADSVLYQTLCLGF